MDLSETKWKLWRDSKYIKKWFSTAIINSKFNFDTSFLNRSQRWYKHLLNLYQIWSMCPGCI